MIAASPKPPSAFYIPPWQREVVVVDGVGSGAVLYVAKGRILHEMMPVQTWVEWIL